MTTSESRTRIVLLFGSGLDITGSSALASERSELTRIMEERASYVQVDVVSVGLDRTIPGVTEHVTLDSSGLGGIDRALKALGAFALRKRFATFPLGRLLNSLGPVDQGRVFWRTMRRHLRAMEVLRNADIALATDLAAVKTAWIAVRRGWIAEAFYDHRAASVGVAFNLPSREE